MFYVYDEATSMAESSAVENSTGFLRHIAQARVEAFQSSVRARFYYPTSGTTAALGHHLSSQTLAMPALLENLLGEMTRESASVVLPLELAPDPQIVDIAGLEKIRQSRANPSPDLADWYASMLDE